MMESIPIHPVLKTWTKEDYAAGLRARFSDIPLSETASHAYRCGWEDANTELLETARHRQALQEGREDHFGATWCVLFDAGADARSNDVRFDATRTEPWKQGWIDIDIKLGLLEQA